MPSRGRDTEPWAPFPVQDWSTLPPAETLDAYADEIGPAPVSPDWAPPPDDRPWWLPLVVITVVAALVAGSFYAADSLGGSGPDVAASRYLPGDGDAINQRREVTRGRETTTTPLVTESARLSGRAALTAVDFAFGTKALGSLDIDTLPRTRFWRTTTTEIGSVTSSQQHVGLYRADAGIELVAESGPGRAFVYRPALVELPADVAPGSTWSGAGSAGDALSYRSEFRAESSSAGCLEVTGTIAYAASTGQPGQTSTIVKTWCPGVGVARSSETAGDVTTTFATVARQPADRELRTVTEPSPWSDPARWTKKSFGAMSIDANYGEGIMTGAPSGQVLPVVTASGLLIRAASSDDLVAFTPKTQTKWTSIWRMHPGGTVLSLAAFGDVLVVTTSQRRAVGYTDAGVRLWELDLAELAFHSPTRVSDTEVALVDVGGDVRVLELTSGTVRWQGNVGAEVTAPPVGDPRAVVVMDGSGMTTAWQPTTGEQLWSTELEGERAAVIGDTVVVRNGSTLEALSITTGEHRWLQSVRGTLDDLRDFGGRVVLATQLRTTVFDENGRVLARLPAYEVLTVNGAHLIGWGVRQADVLGADLTPVSSFDVPDRKFTAATRYVLGYRQGVWMFSSTWEFAAWSDEP